MCLFSVNVWADTVQNIIIGPVFLPNNLTSARYVIFLRDDLLSLPTIYTIHAMIEIEFTLHNGASPHFGRQVRDYLDRLFGTRWIGRQSA